MSKMTWTKVAIAAGSLALVAAVAIPLHAEGRRAKSCGSEAKTDCSVEAKADCSEAKAACDSEAKAACDSEAKAACGIAKCE